MIISAFILVLSVTVLAVLFTKHLALIRTLSEEEVEQKVKNQPSPFQEIEEKIFAPVSLWFSRHLPFFVLKTGETFVNEIRHFLLRLAGALGGVHDYLRGRKISLSNSRKSAYWNEIHDVVKNGHNGNGDQKTSTPA